MIWMKRLLLFLVTAALWIVMTFLFVSKERVCNAALEMLAKEEITLCYEKRETSPLSCEIDYTTLLFAHSPVARIKRFSLDPLEIVAENIHLEGMATQALPPRIERLVIEPLKGVWYARGDFGTAEGKFSLSERKISLTLTPSSLMRKKYGSTLRMLIKKNGKYIYETTF